MLARKQPKEKDAVDRMLDQIDFHGMAKDEILRENGLLKTFTSRLLSRAMCQDRCHLLFQGMTSILTHSGIRYTAPVTKIV